MSFSIRAEKVEGVEPLQLSQSPYRHYRVRVFLQATENDARRLDEIESVTYELHPTFPDRFHKSTDRSTSFEIQIWTWGWFLVRAEIKMKGGEVARTENEIQW